MNFIRCRTKPGAESDSCTKSPARRPPLPPLPVFLPLLLPLHDFLPGKVPRAGALEEASELGPVALATSFSHSLSSSACLASSSSCCFAASDCERTKAVGASSFTASCTMTTGARWGTMQRGQAARSRHPELQRTALAASAGEVAPAPVGCRTPRAPFPHCPPASSPLPPQRDHGRRSAARVATTSAGVAPCNDEPLQHVRAQRQCSKAKGSPRTNHARDLELRTTVWWSWWWWF